MERRREEYPSPLYLNTIATRIYPRLPAPSSRIYREPVVDFLNTLFLIPTFCNLSYTCYAIIQQVIEMRKQRELTIVQLQARLERQDIRFQPIDSA
jgi:hypothetical protein